MNDNILELNDFISYDVEREVFIVKEHTIIIKASEFSINDMAKNSNSGDYKLFLKGMYDNPIISNFISIKQRKKKNLDGNSRWRNAKLAIERHIKKHVFLDKFNIFSTKNMWLWLNKNS